VDLRSGGQSHRSWTSVPHAGYPAWPAFEQ
jgi:hypothetical protein